MAWQDSYDADAFHRAIDEAQAEGDSPLVDSQTNEAYLAERQASTRKYLRDRQRVRDAEAAARRYSPQGLQDAETMPLPEGDAPGPMRQLATRGHPARQFTGNMPEPPVRSDASPHDDERGLATRGHPARQFTGDMPEAPARSDASPHGDEAVVVTPEQAKAQGRQDPVAYGIVQGADEFATVTGLRNERPHPDQVLPEGSTLDSFVLAPAPDEETQVERAAWVDAVGMAEPEGTGPEMVATLAQFGTGMLLTAPVGGPAGMAVGRGIALGTRAALGARRAQKAAQATQVATGGTGFMTTGAMADALAFDPDEHSGLLGQMVDGNPALQGVLADMMLAPDPGADEFAARTQMAVEGAFIGGAAGVTLKVGGLLFKRMVEAVKVRQEGTALGGADPVTQATLRKEADVAVAEGADAVAAELEARTLPGGVQKVRPQADPGYDQMIDDMAAMEKALEGGTRASEPQAAPAKPAEAAKPDEAAAETRPPRVDGADGEEELIVMDDPGRETAPLKGAGASAPVYTDLDAFELQSLRSGDYERRTEKQKARIRELEALRDAAGGEVEPVSVEAKARTAKEAEDAKPKSKRRQAKEREEAARAKMEAEGTGPQPIGEYVLAEDADDLLGLDGDLLRVFRPDENRALEGLDRDMADYGVTEGKPAVRADLRLVEWRRTKARVERRVALVRGLGRTLTPWMDDEALDAYARAERDMVDAYTYYEVGPTLADRQSALSRTFGRFLDVVREIEPEGAAALHAEGLGREWMVEAVRGLRAQAVSPYFNPFRADAVDGMVSRRLRSPAEVRRSKPISIRPTRDDAWTSAQASGALDPITMPGELGARVVGWSKPKAKDDPIDVWYSKIEDRSSFDELESAVGIERDVRRRPPSDETKLAKMREEVESRRLALKELGTGDATPDVYRARGEAREAYWKAREAQQELQDAARMRHVSDADWQQGQQEARRALWGMTGIRGYGFRTGELTGNQSLGVPGRRHRIADHDDHRLQAHTLDAMASTVQRMAVAAGARGATAAMRAEAAAALHKLAAYVEHIYGREAEADALLEIARLPRDLEGPKVGVSKRVKGHDLISRSGGPEHLEAVLASVAMAGDTQAVMRAVGGWRNGLGSGVFAREGHSAGFRQRKAAAYGYSSGLLSRPATWVRNAASSLAFGAVRGGPEKFLSRAISGWQEGGAAGAIRGMDMATREIGASVMALKQGMTDGFRLAALIAKRDANLRGMGDAAQAKIEENGWDALARDMASTTRLDVDETVTYHGLPKGMRDYIGNTPYRPIGEAASKGIAFGFSFGGKGQALSDVVVRTISYRTHLAARAAREGYGKGWTRAQADARIEELMRDPAAHREAMDNAEINSFLKEASDTPTKVLLELKAKHPEVGYVFPFVNTMSNITKQSWKRVPGVQLRDPTLTPQQRADLIAGQMTMVGIMATGGMLLHNGTMTGSLAGQPDRRSAAYKAGWRPFSFRSEMSPEEIPEGSGEGPHYKYLHGTPAMAGPYALPLMVGAVITEAFMAARDGESLTEAMSLGDAALRLLADPLMEMTWAEGGTPVAENLVHILNDEPGRAMKNALRGGSEIVTNIVTPGSSLARQIEKWRLGAAGRRERSGGIGGPDETAREQVLESLAEVVRRAEDLTLGNLGLTEGGSPRINPLTGHPYGSAVPSPDAQRDAGFGHMGYSFVSPYGLSHGGTTKGEQEAMRLGWNAGWPPTKVPVQVPGEEDRYMFWERTPEMMAEWEPRAGKEFERIASAGISSSWYQDKTSHEKRKQLATWMKEAREAAWDQVSSLDRFRDEISDMKAKVEDLGLKRAVDDRKREIARAAADLEAM